MVWTCVVVSAVVVGWMMTGAEPVTPDRHGVPRLGGVMGQFFFAIPAFGDPLTIVSDNHNLPWPAIGARIVYVAFWTFLSGGLLDRLARGRRVGTAAFFAACGVYLVRFARLAVLVGLTYWALRQSLRSYPLLYLEALLVVMVIADFARVRAVVEDRRSMLGAVVASVRFISRHWLEVVALYVFYLGALLLLTWLPGLFLPRFIPVYWLAFPVALLLGILWCGTRLALGASEIALFQHALAHVDYTAAPLPIWPDSPAAEAIENLVQQRGTRGGPGA